MLYSRGVDRNDIELVGTHYTDDGAVGKPQWGARPISEWPVQGVSRIGCSRS